MCFKKPIVSPETIKPTGNIRIARDEARGLFKARYPDAQIFLSDNDYVLCHPDDIALFLAQDQTNKMGYVPEERDCDDFALRLAGQFSIPEWSGLCFGIMWTSTHALCFYLAEDKTLWNVEPQTDGVSPSIDGAVFLMV